MLQNLKQQLTTKGSLYCSVRVVPKASKTEVMEIMADGSYKIRVAAPPKEGKANAALIKFLKKELAASEVKIISGKTERIKLVRITA